MGFSRQEYWTGLPFPSPGDFPDPWIEPESPESPGTGKQIIYLPLCHTWEAHIINMCDFILYYYILVLCYLIVY